MGVFESVRLVCPHCGGETEKQSAASHSIHRTYEPSEAPADILAGVEGWTECDDCGEDFYVAVSTNLTISKHMP
jgi:rRNA maturation protein Nop10